MKRTVDLKIPSSSDSGNTPADQAFERILYVYKTENTSIRRLLDGRVLLGTINTFARISHRLEGIPFAR